MNKRHNTIKKLEKKIGVGIFNPKVTPKKPTQFRTKRRSIYGDLLHEKRKLKAFYSVSERYMSNLASKVASKAKTHKKLNKCLVIFQVLESMLITAIKRAGLATKPGFARQLINHKHISVNGSCVNRPTYLLKPGDVVGLSEKAKSKTTLIEQCQKNIVNAQPSILEPNRIEIDAKSVTFVFKSRPDELSKINYPFSLDFNIVLSIY